MYKYAMETQPQYKYVGLGRFATCSFDVVFAFIRFPRSFAAHSVHKVSLSLFIVSGEKLHTVRNATVASQTSRESLWNRFGPRPGRAASVVVDIRWLACGPAPACSRMHGQQRPLWHLTTNPTASGVLAWRLPPGDIGGVPNIHHTTLVGNSLCPEL